MLHRMSLRMRAMALLVAMLFMAAMCGPLGAAGLLAMIICCIHATSTAVVTHDTGEGLRRSVSFTAYHARDQGAGVIGECLSPTEKKGLCARRDLLHQVARVIAYYARDQDVAVSPYNAFRDISMPAAVGVVPRLAVVA